MVCSMRELNGVPRTLSEQKQLMMHRNTAFLCCHLDQFSDMIHPDHPYLDPEIPDYNPSLDDSSDWSGGTGTDTDDDDKDQVGE